MKQRRTMIRALSAACLAFAAIAASQLYAADDTVLFVVRHAERENNNDNTPLSAAGKKRADQLAQTLEHLRVNAIFHTDKLRSKQTASPSAQKLNITPTLYTDPDQTWIDGLISSQKGKRVLIVGHSDTVHEIVGRLIGKQVPQIGDHYDNLFVVVISDQDKSMVRLKYGASN
jgi:2,3-bisphosphoglycerate-dependent phosphoglycerate mutase